MRGRLHHLHGKYFSMHTYATFAKIGLSLHIYAPKVHMGTVEIASKVKRAIGEIVSDISKCTFNYLPKVIKGIGILPKSLDANFFVFIFIHS